MPAYPPVKTARQLVRLPTSSELNCSFTAKANGGLDATGDSTGGDEDTTTDATTTTDSTDDRFDHDRFDDFDDDDRLDDHR